MNAREQWPAKPRGRAGPNNHAYRPLSERFWEKVARSDGCWVWTGAIGTTGYGQLMIDGKVRTASRVAYELQNGPIPSGSFVLHHCDNRRCVRGDHLYAGDHRQNMVDKKTRGRASGALGERNIRAKLSDADVLSIRASSVGTMALARQYGVHRDTIGRIRRGIQWRHL